MTRQKTTGDVLSAPADAIGTRLAWEAVAPTAWSDVRSKPYPPFLLGIQNAPQCYPVRLCVINQKSFASRKVAV